MRYLNFAGLAATVLFLVPAGGFAQQRKQIHIDQVRVGYGQAVGATEFKAGFWTPVYVDVTAWPEGSIPRGEIIVESVDTAGQPEAEVKAKMVEVPWVAVKS